MADQPHIVLTEFDGTVTRLLLRQGSRIGRGPTTGQQQVTTVGEADRRGDTRTPQVIWSDQTGGMGEFAYQEINGVTTFTDSELDTRYPGMITLPPARTSLGNSGFGTAQRIEYTGLAAARLLIWAPVAIAASPMRLNAGTWTATGLASINSVYAYTTFRGYYIFVTTMANGLWYSTNATAWTNLAYAKTMRGACVHDNKLYIWNATDQRIEWHTDPTAVAGWAASTATFYPLPGEGVVQLFEWQRGGRAVVFILTSKRLMWYDEDADAYLTFYDFSQLGGDNLYPQAHVWKKTGDLYLCFGNVNDKSIDDKVLWFSGTTNTASPNARGGMPSAKRVSFLHCFGGLEWLYFCGVQRFGTSNLGQIMAMNDQQAFHSLGNGLGAGQEVTGMGYAQGLLWTMIRDGTVYEQEVRDNNDLPLYLASGERTYTTGITRHHEYAFTDLGSENMPGLALWVEIAARDMTTTAKKAGMPASGSGTVEYMRDTDTGWTLLGAFTSADAYPVRYSFRGGYGLAFNEIKIRLGIASSVAAESPVITSVGLAALREEAIHDAWACQVDLSDRAHPLYSGKSISQIMAVLERVRQPGALVQLQFAGGDDATAPSTGRTIASCKVEWSGEEDAEAGPGVYSLRLTDYGTPNFTNLINAQAAS